MKQIFAIIAAALMVMAVAVPCAIADDPLTGLDVNSADTTYEILTISDVSLNPMTYTTTGNEDIIDPNTIADGTTDVTITVKVRDNNGIGDISAPDVTITDPNGVGTTLDGNSATAGNYLVTDGTTETVSPTADPFTIGRIYTYTLTLYHYSMPGDYTASVVPNDASENKTFTVNTLSLIYVSDMLFASTDPGASVDGSHKATALGNVAVKFLESSTPGYDNDNNNEEGITWSPLYGSSIDIPDTCMNIKIENSNPVWTELSTLGIVNVGAGSTTDLNKEICFTLNVPLATPVGNYAGTTTFTASIA